MSFAAQWFSKSISTGKIDNIDKNSDSRTSVNFVNIVRVEIQKSTSGVSTRTLRNGFSL